MPQEIRTTFWENLAILALLHREAGNTCVDFENTSTVTF
jgi:hypothetical protein